MIEELTCGFIEASGDTNRGKIIFQNVHGATGDEERDIQVIFWLSMKKEEKCFGYTQDIVSGEDQKLVKNEKEEKTKEKTVKRKKNYYLVKSDVLGYAKRKGLINGRSKRQISERGT